MPAVEVSGQEGLTAWRIPELGLEFEFPVTLIADVIADAKEGFNRFPRGGLEVGGVLFGRREGARIRVLAARSVACKHLLGPSFTLTPEEHEELAALLVQARQDSQLTGLVPVGWYHSHTRSGLIYTDADAHLHNRHFSQAWQFGLLLRPEVGKPTQIGLFVRTKDGELPLRPALVVQEDSLAVEAVAGNGRPENSPEPGASEPGGSGPKLLRRQGSKLRWAASAALAVLVAVALGWPLLSRADWGASWRRIVDYWWREQVTGGQRPFELALAAEGGRLTVSWNPTAPGFQSARAVKLEVRDGAQGRELTLDAAAVTRGSLTLERNSDHVTVTLSVAGGAGGSPRETAHLVGSPPESSSGPGRLPALLEEKERLETALKVQKAEADTLAEQRALFAKLLESRPAREPPPPKPRPEVAEKAPEPAAPQVTLEQRPAAISPTPPAGATPGGVATSAPKPATAANTGRLIWTGALSPGRVLTISGRQASLGSFTGQLPGVPVRIQVFPAELSSAGLVVYTVNPKHAGAGLAEPPGPANAWTRTVYRYAPERADSLQILQAPAASNGWLAITLRANANTTAIVVDWETLR